MTKKVLIFLIILALTLGGFFYWWHIWIPSEMEKESWPSTETKSPTLFSKEDYKIEDRPEGKYIVVEKVGLTCKVPEGWKVKKERIANIEPQYWISFYSPEYATTTGNILKSGCVINIMGAKAEKTTQEIRKNIQILQEERPGELNKLRTNYPLAKNFEIVEISGHQALKIESQENTILGQNINIDIPMQNKIWINLNIASSLPYKEKCFPIWEEFLKNVVIE